jgi:CubicO group peptidase (beta-lactamase class C family)
MTSPIGRDDLRRRHPSTLGRLAGSCALLIASVTAAECARADDFDAALASPLAAEREQAVDRVIETRDASPELLASLAVLLDDADLHVAGKAAKALALRGARAFDTIDGLLRNGSAQQRRGATIALYQTNADIARFLPALTRQLSQDDPLLVRASLSALSRLGPGAAPALPALKGTLAHDDTEIRWATLQVLATIGPAGRDLVPDVLPYLRDEAPELRLAAAAAVRSMEPPAPITAERLGVYIDWLREHVPRLMEEYHVPGISIAIVQRGQVHWTQGFGVADANDATPVSVDTIFEACSMSKPILALSALQLVQDGRLDLDIPLTAYLGHDYLPDQPEHRRITARMALTHRTGLANWRMGYDDLGGPLPLLFAPGSEYSYSGEGILFLQRAMEAISGKPIERLAQEGLFAPLGLTHTSFVWTDDVEEELASGHREDGSFKERSHYRKANGAYSLYTTPSEYARLMLTLMDPSKLGDHAFTRASIDLMLQRHLRVADEDAVLRPGLAHSVATYRALGFSLEVTAEGDIVQHSGSNSTGFKVFGQLNPAKGSGLVIFSNGDNGSRVREAIVAEVGDL